MDPELEILLRKAKCRRHRESRIEYYMAIEGEVEPSLTWRGTAL